MDNEFEAYSVGIIHASVCTSLSDEEATRKLNIFHPTGISSQWEISKENFADGASNPCRCEQKPDTHRHILFNC